jgi:hypothetical protein
LVLALLPTVPPGAALLRWLVRDVPGAGLLRDSQKWILPLPLLTAGLLGAAVARLNELGRGRGWRFALAAAAVSLPPLVLPDGPATLRPTLSPVHYPADWARVVAAAGRGDAAVLPLGSYRRFAWAPGRSVLDPAPRLLAGDTVVDDRLAVSGRVLSGESRRAAAFRAALGDRAALAPRLRRLGLRWVVVEHGTPGAVGALPGLRPVVTGTDVSLYEVPGRVRPSRPATWRVAVVLAGDGLALALLLGLLIRGGWTPMRSMTRTRRKAPRPG